LKAKRKRLIIVFATLYTAKQGVCRAECTEARADDYATGADVTSAFSGKGAEMNLYRTFLLARIEKYLKM
jgi:hypothetical protein